MKDGFDREVDYLRISITDRCNLGCIYCVPGRRPAPFGPDELMCADEVARVVRVSRRLGASKIRLTGGEPLMRRDLLRIISMVKESGVPDLSLTTNGTMLGKMAPALKKAGLDRVNVSIDSMDPERYREMTCGGDLRVVLRSIREAEEAGLDPVKINMVPIRGVNDSEIENFAALTLGKPYHIRFIEFMPAGREGLWDRGSVVTSAETMERVSRLGPLEQLEFRGRGPSRNYRIRGARGMVGFISPVSHSFCYRCNRLRINAVGRIRPCLFSRASIDIAGPMRAGAGDTELERLLRLAVAAKPEGNHFRGSEAAALGSMSKIGG